MKANDKNMEYPIPTHLKHLLKVDMSNEGKPLWGQFETLVDGKWVEYEF